MVFVLVAQLCLTLCDPMDCSPAGSSVQGILQARMLEWVAISFSRESSALRDQAWVSCRQILYCLSHQESTVPPSLRSEGSVGHCGAGDKQSHSPSLLTGL